MNPIHRGEIKGIGLLLTSFNKMLSLSFCSRNHSTVLICGIVGIQSDFKILLRFKHLSCFWQEESLKKDHVSHFVNYYIQKHNCHTHIDADAINHHNFLENQDAKSCRSLSISRNHIFHLHNIMYSIYIILLKIIHFQLSQYFIFYIYLWQCNKGGI